MKTISVRQPWAWLLVNGIKTAENRTWKTNYRGEVLIHASKTMHKSLSSQIAEFNAETGLDVPLKLPAGGIVGVFNLVDCTMTPEGEDAEWHEPGCWAWIVRNAQPLEFFETRGKLNLFQVDYPFPLQHI